MVTRQQWTLIKTALSSMQDEMSKTAQGGPPEEEIRTFKPGERPPGLNDKEWAEIQAQTKRLKTETPEQRAARESSEISAAERKAEAERMAKVREGTAAARKKIEAARKKGVEGILGAGTQPAAKLVTPSPAPPPMKGGFTGRAAEKPPTQSPAALRAEKYRMIKERMAKVKPPTVETKPPEPKKVVGTSAPAIDPELMKKMVGPPPVRQ